LARHQILSGAIIPWGHVFASYAGTVLSLAVIYRSTFSRIHLDGVTGGIFRKKVTVKPLL
jgi:hypothetical protein